MQQHSYVEPLDGIDASVCLYQFRGTGNAPDADARYAGTIDWEFTPPAPADYRRSFDTVRRNLLGGNSYLTNLTCKVPLRTNLTLKDVFLHSHALYKLWLKDRFVCFSPEIFVRMEEGRIKSFPMKGTIDATLPHAESILLDDAKEAAEHATIVDLIRNDLSMVSEHVTVASYRYIDRLQTNKGPILQTSSEICGMLPGDYTKRCRSGWLRTGILYRSHGLLRRRTAGQRRHDTLHRAGKRTALFQSRRRHHRPKPLGKRIQRSNTENICADLLKPYGWIAEKCAIRLTMNGE